MTGLHRVPAVSGLPLGFYINIYKYKNKCKCKYKYMTKTGTHCHLQYTNGGTAQCQWL